MEMATDIEPQEPTEPTAAPGYPEPSKEDKALVDKIAKRIKADKQHHAKAFEAMRRDMFVARNGYVEGEYPATSYKANISGRHVKQKTAALFAKNPRIVAKRRETMDFAAWDENPDTLKMAFDTIQQAVMMAAQPPAIVADPMTGEPTTRSPQPPPGFEEAQLLVADFQQGMQRRQLLTRYGKTLELLFTHFMKEGAPLDFKMALKRVVRRACTTGVGYVELGFQREKGPRPGLAEQLADSRARLDHIQRLVEEQGADVDPDDAEQAELQHAIASLQAEPEIVLREGLVFDYPQSTKVIPDKMCRGLVGFIGARHLTIEYIFTRDEVQEMFGVDLGDDYTGYKSDGKTSKDDSANFVPDDSEIDAEATVNGKKGDGLVCVWKHYDKPSGLVYYLADGCKRFLRPPAAPDVFVESFWPVFALTFNEVESETTLFPPSDVALMSDMQAEYNRSRQGLREHRTAARPRWIASRGALSDTDIETLKKMNPFDVGLVDKDPQTKIGDLVESMPVPGVDPNLYETGPIFSDTQYVVGAQEASFGGTSKATATESAIAANSTQSSDQASIDELDGLLTMIARAGGQILQREMSEEQVKKIVGPGAIWPELPLAEIAAEIYLEVEAGSSGRPNQAVEVQNFKELGPLLLQIPGINPTWLAKEAIRRLDDRIDLNEAVASSIPSIVAANRQATANAGADPAADPAVQGEAGGDNGPQPPGQGGSEPAFGSNQV